MLLVSSIDTMMPIILLDGYSRLSVGGRDETLEAADHSSGDTIRPEPHPVILISILVLLELVLEESFSRSLASQYPIALSSVRSRPLFPRKLHPYAS